MTTTLSGTRTITTGDLHYLICLLGPEEVAKLTGPPTPADLAAIDEFADLLTAMTDDEIRVLWGIQDGALISEIRDLFAR